MKIETFKKLKIPDKPGIYFFLRGKEILYIGKATSLKNRVKSYFGKDLIETRGPLLVDLIFKADKIKWQEMDSVLEALILEATLIKKHQPKYNTKEKSDKSFNYVIITKEKLPKVFIIRERNIKKDIKYQAKYGPFTNGSQLREAIKIIRKIFPFLDEKSKNYIEFYRQINLVPDLNDKKIYLQNIKNIKLFFSGKKKRIISNLKKEMNAFSKNREFEKAGEIKRQLFALQHINDVALLKEDNPSRDFRIEAYDVAHMGGKNMVGVMVVLENREVEKNEYRKFKIRTQSDANDTGALKEVLERRLAHTEWQYPNLIVVDGGIAQINIVKSVLLKGGIQIPIVSVIKDERHKPKAIKGNGVFIKKYKREILLANSEAHRFAITYHKKVRAKSFLK
jgi:excinuclease ABC subunit C